MSMRSAGLAAAVLAATALAGCGVSAQSAPQPVDPPRGPFQAVTSPTPAATDSGPVAQRLFMVKDGKLVAVTRHADRQPTVQTLIDDLLAGPTKAERDAGITSALQGAATVSGVRLDGDRATIELAAPLAETGRNDEVLAYAQVVCTLTARPEIRGVTFTRHQQPVRVPRADGQLSQGPLTAADYADLVGQK